MLLSPQEQLQAMGITLAQAEEQAPPEKVVPKFKEVEEGPEMLRILSLPSRPIPSQDDPANIALAAELTRRLSYDGGAYPGPMRPIQAISLRECWENRGGYLMLRVGAGKTLIGALLPTIIRTERPIYVTAAKMVKPIAKEFAKIRRHWRMVQAHEYGIFSFEKFSSKKQGEIIDNDGKVVMKGLVERLRPTMIVIDEGHMTANSSAAVTSRLRDYVEKYPDTVVVIMTGTPFKTSIKDLIHQLEWALSPSKIPLPGDFEEREMWASYLDAKKGFKGRVGVGALTKLLNDEEMREFMRSFPGDDQRSVVRRAIGRRILETPGIIGTQDPPLSTKLTIEARIPRRMDPQLEAAIEELREKWALPDGTEFADPREFARHISTLGLGFWQKWDPDPGIEYRLARNDWAKWCRRMIKLNRRGIETEGRMKDAVKAGLYDDEGKLEAWEQAVVDFRAAHKMLEPPSVSVWVSDEAIWDAGEWAQQYGGLIWVHHIGLGERLSEKLGIPYYGAKGLSARGVDIENHPGGPAVASKLANGTGKNLQFLWSDNLWLTQPDEQSLGRTHRAGQKAAVVRNWIYLGCAEHLNAYFAAKCTKSRFHEEMTLSPQKLGYADTDMPTLADLRQRGGARWQIATKDDEP